MIIIERLGALVGDVFDDIRRRENLLDHLKTLANGQLPTAAEIAAAPSVEQSRLALRADAVSKGSRWPSGAIDLHVVTLGTQLRRRWVPPEFTSGAGSSQVML